MHLTYLYFHIYTLLLIHKPFGSLAAKVSISQNITGLIGNIDIPLTCSFTNDANEKTTKVELFAKNKTDDFDDVRPIAIFELDKPGRLITSGNYLKGRVTLTNITSTSTNATLTFHVLKCEDERDYMCQCEYNDNDGASLPKEKSPPTRISVQESCIKIQRSNVSEVEECIAVTLKHAPAQKNGPRYKKRPETNTRPADQRAENQNLE
ncbi:unnamed protein product [Mytilus coruscus]|uniref:Immunoglobulin V-set domain-containing protein n=1 Tax=Mytilus coruscus TaxID=42192 RepID=A0A6J8EZL9_MYTCO|nr:unnamed protein product [Mytilus coruscus]